MARLVYVLVANLGTEEDFGSFIVDLAKAEEVWKNKTRKITNSRTPSMV
jgi:hypothetical protein